MSMTKTLGIIAVVVAVASLFVCAPLVPFFALPAIALAIVSIREGEKGWGITALIISALTLVFAAALLYQAGQKLEQIGKELQQMSEKCVVCGGKGWTDCSLCVNGRLPNGAVCLACNGRGTVVCSFCNGTGKAR